MAKFSRFDPQNKKQNRNKFLNQEKLNRIRNTKIEEDDPCDDVTDTDLSKWYKKSEKYI